MEGCFLATTSADAASSRRICESSSGCRASWEASSGYRWRHNASTLGASAAAADDISSHLDGAMRSLRDSCSRTSSAMTAGSV